jgi:hypothetical protein
MSLGLLVGRFGDLVREQIPAQQVVFIPEEVFPAQLQRLRAEFGHHLIPLVLLSRIDGNCVEAEREAIVAHCLAMAEKSGIAVNEAERDALAAYIAEFRPTFAQLEPALKRIENESAENIAALIASAIAVVDADGERRAVELGLLAELEQELRAVTTVSADPV